MDASAHRLLEATTHKTLHSQGFSRSSSQASLVLTDLLSRYLTLLTATCSKYAEHAGRTGLTTRDALSALDELGVSVEELGEYCVSEGHELRRYNVHTAHTVAELQKFKGQSSCATSTTRFYKLIFSPTGRRIGARPRRCNSPSLRAHARRVTFRRDGRSGK